MGFDAINVDYHLAPPTDLSWLSDADDHPVMLTALAAEADVLVVRDDATDFPSGERRNGVLLLESTLLLKILVEAMPEFRVRAGEYLLG